MRGHAGSVMTIMAFSWTAMLIMAWVTPCAMAIGNKWVALGGAAAMMLAALVVYLVARFRWPAGVCKPLWLLCHLMNSAANGLSAAALYIHGAQAVDAASLLRGMLPGMGVMAVVAMMLICFPERKKLALWIGGILSAVLVVMSFIPAVWDVQPQRSAMFFGALIAIFYLVAYGMHVGRGEWCVLRDISFGSFGAAMIIGFVVLVIITEGDALDFADLGDLDFSWKKKKTKSL